jgi:hypothetical protein
MRSVEPCMRQVNRGDEYTYESRGQWDKQELSLLRTGTLTTQPILL